MEISKEKGRELEIRFGLPLPYFGGDDNLIIRESFQRVLKYIRNDEKYSISSSTQTMDIRTHKMYNKTSKYDPKVRIELLSNTAIQSHCRTGKMPSSETIIGVKSPLSLESIQNDENIDKIPSKGNLDLNSLGVRISLRDEVELKNEKGGSVPEDWNTPNNILAKKASDEFNEYQNLLRRYGSLSSIPKTYRLKKRFSFMVDSWSGENPKVRLDCTIVKSSRPRYDAGGKAFPRPVKDIEEADIHNQESSYEIELEIVDFEDIDGTIKDVMRVMAELLPIIQGGPAYLPINEKLAVKQMFKRTVNIHRLSNIQYAQGVIDTIIKKNGDELPDWAENWSNINQRVLEGWNDLLQRRKENLQNELPPDQTLFIGPKVISMLINHARDDILKNYTVTDKADGLGVLIYIAGGAQNSVEQEYEGRVYLMDTNGVWYATGLKEVNGYREVIMNAEYVTEGRMGIPLSLALIYDCYHLGRDPSVEGQGEEGNQLASPQSLLFKPLMTADGTESRLGIASDILNKARFVSIGSEEADGNKGPETTELETHSLPISLELKTFLLGGENIYKASKQIWDEFKQRKTRYYMDGLIFTPANMPVGFSQKDWQWILAEGRTWSANFKWKPPEDNTIDFLVHYEMDVVAKKSDGKEVKKPKVQNRNISVQGGRTIFENEVNIALFVGGRPKQIGVRDYFQPMHFWPARPATEKPVVASLIQDSRGFVRGERDKLPIEEDTIVEFAYDTDKKEWKPLRTRFDKTRKYKSGKLEQRIKKRNIDTLLEKVQSRSINRQNPDDIELIQAVRRDILRIPNLKRDKNSLLAIISQNIDTIRNFYNDMAAFPVDISYGNAETVAQNVWSSIHAPVTEEMITTGEGIPSEDAMDAVYYAGPSFVSRDKSLTFGLQSFHNRFIKDMLYSVAASISRRTRPVGLRIFDLAVGKAGDLPRWKSINATEIVGVDLSRDNIMNPRNGALARSAGDKGRKYKFMVGNSSKVLIEDGISTEDKKSYEKIYNEGATYDIVVVMFALHYFTKDSVTLSNIIKNIKAHLRPGGVFIGACYNGKRVFNMLENSELGGYKKGIKDGEQIWKIKKSYETDEWKDNSRNMLGEPIDVFMYSIGQELREYLVPFDYLDSLMAQEGLRPLAEDELTGLEVPPDSNGKLVSRGKFEDAYAQMKKSRPDLDFELSDAEKEISFLNDWFIYKRD